MESRSTHLPTLHHCQGNFAKPSTIQFESIRQCLGQPQSQDRGRNSLAGHGESKPAQHSVVDPGKSVSDPGPWLPSELKRDMTPIHEGDEIQHRWVARQCLWLVVLNLQSWHHCVCLMSRVTYGVEMSLSVWTWWSRLSRFSEEVVIDSERDGRRPGRLAWWDEMMNQGRGFPVLLCDCLEIEQLVRNDSKLQCLFWDYDLGCNIREGSALWNEKGPKYKQWIYFLTRKVVLSRYVAATRLLPMLGASRYFFVDLKDNSLESDIFSGYGIPKKLCEKIWQARTWDLSIGCDITPNCEVCQGLWWHSHHSHHRTYTESGHGTGRIRE